MVFVWRLLLLPGQEIFDDLGTCVSLAAFVESWCALGSAPPVLAAGILVAV